MNNIKHKIAMISASMLLAFASAGVSAQTIMQSKATVAAACEISSPTIAYGDISGMKINTEYYQEFEVNIKCSNETAYRVNSTNAHDWQVMNGAQTGTSSSLRYLFHRWGGSSWQFFGLQRDGDPHTLQGRGTGNIVAHRMRSTLKAINQLPAPDNYSSNTTIILTF